MLTPRSGICALCAVGIASAAQGAMLNLNLLTPDITTGFMSAGYNAGTDVFTATGTALTIEFDGIAPPDHAITGGTFMLTATIDSGGNLVSGSLTITGTVAALGAGSPLLTATLTDFGFSSAPLSQIFEFSGSVTGGSQAGAFGTQVGTVLGLGGGFAGNFNQNFSNSGFGSADTARIIPAPAAAGVLGLAGLVGLSRRRR